MTKLTSGILIALTLTLLNSTIVQAASNNYKVELLIFSQQTSDTLDDEIWPSIDTIPAHQSRSLGYHQAGQNNGYFTRLPKSSLSLSAKQASLRRSPLYRVLFHEAWIQPVGQIKHQHMIRINGGEMLDNGLYELDGYISVERGRYLHFRSDLFHSRRLSPSERQMLLTAPSLSTTSTQTEALSTDTMLHNPNDSSNGNRHLTQTTVPDFLTVEMKAARRMRSNELHYLDHPLFGMLVRITRID